MSTEEISEGDEVLFAVYPDWVSSLPEDSRRVFKKCFGKVFRVAEIHKNGLYELCVADLIDPLYGGYKNSIYLEKIYLKKIEK